MRKSISGFTIVELLIVIVVIAILATISVVGYNGIKTRAENSKSFQAASTWFKALKAYEADNGELPHMGFGSCLGENYPWEFEGNTSGTNQCRSNTISYYVEKEDIHSALLPYMNDQVPSPSMQALGTPEGWSRGIYYAAGSIGGGIFLSVVQRGIWDCPSLNGVTGGMNMWVGSGWGSSSGVLCQYRIGTRLR